MEQKIKRMLVILIIAFTSFLYSYNRHSKPADIATSAAKTTNADFDFTSPIKIVLAKFH